MSDRQKHASLRWWWKTCVAATTAWPFDTF
jgi:hypothetical protein